MEGTNTYEAHKVVGIVAVTLVFTNWWVGFFRPTKQHSLRTPFVYVHIGLGVVTLTLGYVACFLGICLYNKLTGDSVKAWVG